jgi:AcrR family transcriptional regulator
MKADVKSPEAVRKLRRDAQRNHDKIVEAARELFPKRGIDISLDDIARHAGVGVATAYRHFPEKDKLIDAVFADTMARIVEAAEGAAAEARAWDGLVIWLTSIAELQASDAGVRALMTYRSRGGERAREAHERISAAISTLVRRARTEGDLRQDFDLSDMAVLNYMLRASIEVTEDVRPGNWRRYLELLLDGLRSSREQPSKLPTRALSRQEIERALMD